MPSLSGWGTGLVTDRLRCDTAQETYEMKSASSIDSGALAEMKTSRTATAPTAGCVRSKIGTQIDSASLAICSPACTGEARKEGGGFRTLTQTP